MMLSSLPIGLSVLLSLLSVLDAASAFPSYGSDSALVERDFSDAAARIKAVYPEPPPGRPSFTGLKLVNDPAHLWQAPRPGDMRGPCPALNTLANHGYLPRDGVVTPKQLIQAAQQGFNLETSLAVFVTYSALLVDGNILTNKMSIGGKTGLTGPDPPGPVVPGGLSQAGMGIEGDASLVHGDAFSGNNDRFNETLFEEFKDFSNRFGGGFYNLTVAAELRHHSIQRAIATNPEFSFVAPRFFTAYAESAVIATGMVDGRKTERKLDMDSALSFFKYNRFPDDFHRASAPVGSEGAAEIFGAHPIAPGTNVAGVNTYTPDPTSANLAQFCLLYKNFVERTVRRLYPNPTGALRRNLILNLKYCYSGGPSAAGCEELTPYGTL